MDDIMLTFGWWYYGHATWIPIARHFSAIFMQPGYSSACFISLAKNRRRKKKLCHTPHTDLIPTPVLFIMAEVHPSWSSPSPSSLGSPTAPDELINSLRDHSLFQRSNNAMFLEDIARNMHIRTYGPRDVIIVEGEQAKAMFLLLRGSVDVCSADFERLYATLDQGTCFGEIGILYSIPRTATVVAKSKCTVAVLTAEKVASILPDYPEVEQILRNEAQERLAMLNKCPNEPTTRRSSMIASFDATSARNHLQKVSLLLYTREKWFY